MTSAQRVLAQTTARLRAASPSPETDAWLLLTHVLECDRSALLAHPDRQLTARQATQLAVCLARRLAGEPIAYILKHWGFWSFDLRVSPATLIPRPETEQLVEWVLSMADNAPRRVVDLGTGSGAIALALAHERPAWDVWAVDKTPACLAIAADNAAHHGLAKRVHFACGDWAHMLKTAQFDMVVSNPPYIAADDPHLQQGDVRFEPKSALVGGQTGLACYAAMLPEVQRILKPGGLVVWEHGDTQSQALTTLLQDHGFQAVQPQQDWSGKWRMIAGQYVS